MTLRRPLVSFAMLIAGAALLLTALTHTASGGSPRIRDGGTFNISIQAADFDYVDPALSYSWALLDATCARLMNHPDKPGPAGLRLVPEVAAGSPRVSSDGRTYTFALRSGFRFSDGTPVQASAFAHAINRILTKGIDSPFEQFVQEIVGAGAVRAGQSATAAGGEKVKLGFWQTFRLFLMPFCVFELFSPGEGQGICPHFSHHNPERSCSPWATALPSQSVIRRSITESCARTIPSAAATSLVVSLS